MPSGSWPGAARWRNVPAASTGRKGPLGAARQRVQSAGFDDHLVKPMELKRVIRAIAATGHGAS